MTHNETPAQLRERAARIRQSAQYADGPAYHREMQQAQHLLARAQELEAAAATATSPEQAAPLQPFKPAGLSDNRRTGNRSCVSGTSAVHGGRTAIAPGSSGTSPIPGGRTAIAPGSSGTSPIPGGRKRDRRTRDLSRIHLLKKQAGLDDDTYRDILQQLTGKRSASQLTGPERYKVIGHLMQKAGAKAGHPGRPNNLGKSPQLQKIEALLAEAKRPWEYARAMAERMYRKKRLEWCDSEQLGGIITALTKDAARHGRKTQ